jgi:hypothetical protein
MKGLLHRNPLLASAAIAVLVALAATGYALAFGHGGHATATQARPAMMVPF